MGATHYDDDAGCGVTFRSWAPFASSVHVTGSFNLWSETQDPLYSEGNGYWSADIPTAQVGHEYKFVMKTGQGNKTWRVDTYAREVRNSNGNSVIAPSTPFQEPAGYSMPPWHDLVVYELHVGTFNEDPDGPDRRGTFRSIIPKLPYLKDLGINAIQLLPANEFATDISWGYNPAHLFAIETSYGGPNGLRDFVQAAHQHGIAVIFDVVYNHWGPSDIENSVWRFDGWQENDYGGIYFYNDWRADTQKWGQKNRPDFGREEVRRFIRDSALRWLQERHCDGLRWDATNYIRNVYGREDSPDDPNNLSGWGWNLMKWINDEKNYYQPWKISIAEDMQQNQWLTKPTSENGAGFDSQWDAGFLHPIRGALTASADKDRSMWEIKAAIDNRYGASAFSRVIYTESHDEVAAKNGKRRLTEDIHPGQADSWESQKRSTLGAALVFTSPGIPMIFQGQEMLEWVPFDDVNRVDWNKYEQFKGIFYLYRDLIRLRRNWFDNTRGLRGHHCNVFHTNPDEKVMAFHRWENGGPGDDVVVILNFKNQAHESYTIGLPLSGYWYVRFNSDWNGYSGNFDNHNSYNTTADWGEYDNLPCHGNIGIGRYSAIILSQ
jgi:1,4-alpha-glucan branching enzyme